MSLRSSGLRHLAVSPSVNPSAQKYSTLPKFGNGVCVAHSGSSLRGDLVVVLIASRACDGRGSVGTRGAGRAGSPCEPVAACGRAALLGFVSSVSFRLCRQGWENCGEMASRAYGKTVWSRPSLPRSSSCGDASEPNRADCIIQFAGRGRPKESSAPGRARHKPSDHRAGKAECSAPPVCCCAVVLRYISRSRPRVRAGTRPSLRPLGFEGGEMKQSSGELSREAAKACLRFDLPATNPIS